MSVKRPLALIGLLLPLTLALLPSCSTIQETPDRTVNIGGISLHNGPETHINSSQATSIFDAVDRIHDTTYWLKAGSRQLCGVHVAYESGFSFLNEVMLERISPSAVVEAMRKSALSKDPSNLHMPTDFWGGVSDLTRNRLDRMEIEAGKIDEKLKNGIPVLTNTPELNAIIQ